MPQDAFVALYAPLIYSWGCRAGLQDADAADLVQEVLSLIRALPTFAYDRHKSFRRWLGHHHPQQVALTAASAPPCSRCRPRRAGGRCR